MTLLAPRLRRLTLSDYRSYAQARCDIAAPLVALVGENGAGKTNVLEALSLYSPAAACAAPNSPTVRGATAAAVSPCRSSSSPTTM